MTNFERIVKEYITLDKMVSLICSSGNPCKYCANDKCIRKDYAANTGCKKYIRQYLEMEADFEL